MVREKRVVYKSHGKPSLFFRRQYEEQKKKPVDSTIYELKKKELEELAEKQVYVSRAIDRLRRKEIVGEGLTTEQKVTLEAMEEEIQKLHEKVVRLRFWLKSHYPSPDCAYGAQKRTIIQKRSE